MSLSETAKLIDESRKIVENTGESQNASVILSMILKLVSSIDNRLQCVEQSVIKIEEFKNVITSITSRLVTAEKTINECRSKMSELETNIQGVGNLFDDVKSKTEKNRVEIKKIASKFQADIAHLKTEQKTCDCEEKVSNLRSEVLDLKCRSMKNNLIFTGLHEVSDEDTEALLREFLYKELGIDYNIEFGSVHRFGRNSWGRRPIVARFLYYRDLQYVLDNAFRLKGKQFGISPQFPLEIEERRRKLYPVLKEAKRNRRKVIMVRDRLYIDNELYILPEERRGGDNRTENGGSAITRTPVNRENARPQKRQSIHSSTPPPIR